MRTSIIAEEMCHMRVCEVVVQETISAPVSWDVSTTDGADSVLTGTTNGVILADLGIYEGEPIVCPAGFGNQTNHLVDMSSALFAIGFLHKISITFLCFLYIGDSCTLFCWWWGKRIGCDRGEVLVTNSWPSLWFFFHVFFRQDILKIFLEPTCVRIVWV